MKLLIPHKIEDGDLNGKTLICITNKYGNITVGEEYPVRINLGLFVIDDDESDEMTIQKGWIGKYFKIKEQPNEPHS